MISRYFVIAAIILIAGCTTQPEIVPDETTDLSYEELKSNFGLCTGKGIVISRGDKPWKLNYSFATQNDSSFIQFKDIFGRRVLFIQALPIDTKIWDMQKNQQYYYDGNISIPLLNLVNSKDIAQILWGEIPYRFQDNSIEYNSERDSDLVNFDLSASNLGMVLSRVTFKLDSIDTQIEFKIYDRNYGKTESDLLKGIPQNIPYN